MLSICVTQADLLMQLRNSRGISQKTLSIDAKISYVTVSRSEGAYTELQPSTAVRLLKVLNAHAPFSLEELAQIQETFGVSAGLFSKSPPPSVTPADQTPAALTAAIVGIVGSDRATQLLRSVLASEAQRFKPMNAVSFSPPESPGHIADSHKVAKVITPTGKAKDQAKATRKRNAS